MAIEQKNNCKNLKKKRHSGKKERECPQMSKESIPQLEEIFKRIREEIHQQDSKAFNRRDIGLKLSTFLIVFTICACMMKNVTLEGLAIKCEKLQYGLHYTKQALKQRLGAGNKELIILLSTLMISITKPVEKDPLIAAALKQFTAVLLTDATTISLPDKLSKEHKGLGGTNAKSAMKIQGTYDVISKQFRKIAHIANATENDATYMDELIKLIKAGELTINDLGYYGVNYFQQIDEKGAYFMSKIKSNTKLYTEENQPINLARELRGKSFIDKTVIIKGDGGKLSMAVRICGVRLSEKDYNKRLRKANKKAKSSGKTLSKEEKIRLKWVFIITNVPIEMLDCRTICEMYRLRWQIELVFKSWKSHFAIDQMNNVGKDYWDCLLFGKLAIITMLTVMHSHVHYFMLKTSDRGVSFLRFMEHMREELDIILDCLTFDATICQSAIDINRIIRASLLEKRQRKTTEQSIFDFQAPYDSHVSTNPHSQCSTTVLAA